MKAVWSYCMQVCVGVFGQVVGVRWESGLDLKERGWERRGFHLVPSPALSSAAVFLPGGAFQGHAVKLTSYVETVGGHLGNGNLGEPRGLPDKG